jgi:hypothetical protein
MDVFYLRPVSLAQCGVDVERVERSWGCIFGGPLPLACSSQSLSNAAVTQTKHRPVVIFGVARRNAKESCLRTESLQHEQESASQHQCGREKSSRVAKHLPLGMCNAFSASGRPVGPPAMFLRKPWYCSWLRMELIGADWLFQNAAVWAAKLDPGAGSWQTSNMDLSNDPGLHLDGPGLSTAIWVPDGVID